MPVFTMPSAALRTASSFTLQPNLFQLFQPMGGVLASPSSRAGRLAAKKSRYERAKKRVRFIPSSLPQNKNAAEPPERIAAAQKSNQAGLTTNR
jgi:hypothetical protein